MEVAEGTGRDQHGGAEPTETHGGLVASALRAGDPSHTPAEGRHATSPLSATDVFTIPFTSTSSAVFSARPRLLRASVLILPRVLRRLRTQKLVNRATRTLRGAPGEMFVLLSALTKYLRSNTFSTLTCRRSPFLSVKYAAPSAYV